MRHALIAILFCGQRAADERQLQIFPSKLRLVLNWTEEVQRLLAAR
jgi:hypothetical protein